MPKRKNKIVDKKFQLKMTYSLIGIIFIAFMLILALLATEATMRNRSIRTILNDLDNAIEVEDNIVSAFLAYSKVNNPADIKISTKKIVKDHEDSILVLKELASLLKHYEDRNFITISAIIGIIILLGIFLYFYMINVTHRISGPIYVVRKYMEEIIAGGRPEFRDLREKDEFKEFYRTFVVMMQELNIQGKENKSEDAE
ncbi:MAG TPA: hypothetical protein PK926_11355 [Spirochaetota bacterium]|nr:hypothetical protein [Spirochaetota bacterium]HPI88299.1 hypothetical protein [Spirochaetota bacterium]HPR47763.1 hypothetical protein [Spirochaetota bacterium]